MLAAFAKLRRWLDLQARKDVDVRSNGVA
jgi:hypothetical protein